MLMEQCGWWTGGGLGRFRAHIRTRIQESSVACSSIIILLSTIHDHVHSVHIAILSFSYFGRFSTGRLSLLASVPLFKHYSAMAGRVEKSKKMHSQVVRMVLRPGSLAQSNLLI